MAHIFRAPSKLYNATCEIAKPLITIYGYGAGMLTVGSITLDILTLEDHVTLDCESMNAYRKAADGTVENKNSEIHALEFPVLTPGENVISWSGDITQVEIVPRWWTL